MPFFPNIFSKSPNKDVATLASDLEARFSLFESSSQKQFDESLEQHRQRFLEEEKAQGLGEKRRMDDFDMLVKTADEEFKASSVRYEGSFEAAEAAREKIFETNEESRKKRFGHEEKRRNEIFKQTQDAREENAKWHAQSREAYLDRGRRMREEAFEGLEQEMEEQVGKFLELFEEYFQSAERQREEIVVRFVELGVRPQSREVWNEPTEVEAFYNRTYPQYPEPTVIVQRPSSRSSSIRSRRSRSRSPTAYIRALTPRSRSPSIHRHPHRRSRSPSWPNTKGSDVQAKHRPYTFDTRLVAFLRQLQDQFDQGEKLRKSRFEEAERRRDAAESERTEALAEKQRKQVDSFRDMLNAHSNSFKSNEADRNAREEWRNQQFDSAELGRSEIAELLLLRDKGKFEATDKFEDDWLDFLKLTIKQVDQKQRRTLTEAKERRMARFREAQARRSTQLLAMPTAVTPPHPTTLHPPTQVPVTIITPPLPPTHVPPVTIIPPHYDSRSRSASPRRRRRSSPAAGFDTQALFRGPGLFDDLPIGVLGDGINVPRQLSETKTWQVLFDKSHARQEEIFQNGIRERRRQFAVSEARREAEFETAQIERKELADQGRRERDKRFFHAQSTLADEFRANEKKREEKFLKAERTRDARFRDNEMDREKKFASHETELQKLCADHEKRRQSDCNDFVTRLLPDRAEELLDEYKNEEMAREKIFARSIDFSTIRARK